MGELAIVDEQVGVAGQFHQPGVQRIQAVADVGGVHQDRVAVTDAIPKDAARMGQSLGRDPHVIAHDNRLAAANLFDEKVRLQIVHAERQVGIAHLPGQDLLQLLAHPPLAEDDQPVVPRPGRSEKGQTLDMIPVGVAEEQDNDHALLGAAHQVISQQADTGPGVQNQNLAVLRLNLDTGGIAAASHSIRAGDRDGTAHSPEFYLHRPFSYMVLRCCSRTRLA